MRIAAALALALALPACRSPAAERPPLYLITSLPLLFGETFGLAFVKPDITLALERAFTLRAVDLPSDVPPRTTLLMVQPRALPAEELVRLDAWVRSGGRLVLLADPLLQWPSERPLGDPLRAPPMFADTGLLGHWGVRLDAPDSRASVAVSTGAGTVTFPSPGRLVATAPDCFVTMGGVRARCRIGHGFVTIVADADWLEPGLVERTGGRFDSSAVFLKRIVRGDL